MSFEIEYYTLIEFLNRGGIMLYAIFIFSVVLWGLLIERFLYIYLFISKTHNEFLSAWKKHDKDENSMIIREAIQNQFSCKLKTTLPIIKTLIAIVPLLGLLGTVWGMIEIFDVIAIEGTGDAKAMANGISMATLPTMSGMAIAIVSLFAFRKLEDKTEKQILEFRAFLK
jgi:biopolymer transport protein ExbB